MLRSQQREEEPAPRVHLPIRQEVEEELSPALAPAKLAPGIPPTTEAWRALWQTLVVENPVYHKECRSLPGQKRKPSPMAQLFERTVLATIVAGCYYGLIHLFFLSGVASEPGAQKGVALGLYSVLMGLASLTLVLGPASSSSSIPKERAKQTWNALLLTRLTPQQILLGKLLPYYRSIRSFLLFLAPAILLCGVLGGVPLWSFGLTAAVAAVTSVLSGILSLRGGLLQRAPREMHRGPWAVGPALAAASPAVTVAIYFVAAFSTEVLKLGDGVFRPDAAFHYLASLLPNLLNPITSFGFSLPLWDETPVPLPLRLAVIALYLGTATLFTRALWRRTLEQFWHAPKDNTG